MLLTQFLFTCLCPILLPPWWLTPCSPLRWHTAGDPGRWVGGSHGESLPFAHRAGSKCCLPHRLAHLALVLREGLTQTGLHSKAWELLPTHYPCVSSAPLPFPAAVLDQAQLREGSWEWGVCSRISSSTLAPGLPPAGRQPIKT